MADLPRTLFVGRGATGICWYRCALPAMALGLEWVGRASDPPDLTFSTGVTSRRLASDDLFDYEVVVVQQPDGPGWLRAIRRLQDAGITVLFEIDDYIQAVHKIKTHELRNAFTRDWVRSVELNMRAADGVICSTEYLARRYRSLNTRTWVCPNGIDLKRYDYEPPPRSGTTIGWAGGVGHKASVRRWLPAVAEVLRQRPETRFVTVGHPFAEELQGEFGPERCVAIPFSQLEFYPASLTTFDLALAPSGDNNLFRGKSDLRWLEASALGIPVVGDPGVYPEIEDGVTGLHATTAEEATKAILTLVDDAELRRRLGDAAHAHVVEHRRIEVVAQRWVAVLREAAGERAAAA